MTGFDFLDQPKTPDIRHQGKSEDMVELFANALAKLLAEMVEQPPRTLSMAVVHITRGEKDDDINAACSIIGLSAEAVALLGDIGAPLLQRYAYEEIRQRFPELPNGPDQDEDDVE